MCVCVCVCVCVGGGIDFIYIRICIYCNTSWYNAVLLFHLLFFPVLNGVLIFRSNLLLSFFRICLMYTLIWACVVNIRSKVTIFITYIPRENGERNYALNTFKWNCWPKISHRIQRFVIYVYDPSSVEDLYYFHWFWSFSHGRQDYCKQFISYLLF